MKNTILKDTFREIRKSRGRFFSIFAIVAIGVAFFAGLMASAPTMQYTADRYFDDYNLMDYRVLSNFGMTEEDVSALRQLEGIEGVMPAYSADVLVSIGDSETVLRVHSLNLDHLDSTDPDYINQLKVVEGRLPEKSGECVIESGKIMENSLEIGDTMTLRSGDGEDIADSFRTTTYTIVGKVNTPYYLSYEKGTSTIGDGSVGLYAFVPMTDFSMEVYTEVYLTASGAVDFNSYQQDYFDYIEPLTSNLQTLGIERSDIRREDILSEAQQQYDEGYAQYQQSLEEFNTLIADAQQKLEEGRLEILSGELTLQNNKDLAELQFDNAQQQIDTSKEQVAQLQQQADQAEQAYLEGNAEAIRQREETQQLLDEALIVQSEKNAALQQAQSDYDALAAVNQQILDLQQSNEELQQANQTLQQQLDELNPDSEEYRQITDQIQANEQQISANNTTLEQLRNQYPTLETDLAAAFAALQQAQSEATAADSDVQRYQATITLIDQGLASARQMLDALQAQIESAQTQISEGEAELAAGKQQAQQQFAKAEAQLAQARIDYQQGQQELQTQQAEGEAQLEDAREELVRAQNEIDQIEEAQWYVLDRESHYSYMDYKGAADRMEAISAVFPVFFFLVAALVCLTTMTRMVDEQRSQIGTMKALGYSTAAIAFKYVFYAAVASFFGSLLGLAFGMFAFPAIIYTAWNMMYILPPVQFTLQLPLMIVSTLISVLVTTLAAFSACYRDLTETPALLMRPKAPKLGKKILLERIHWLWSRLSFTSKVTARNIFRYKKRFFMTVIGISGCTALLIAGFGIKDSISTIVDAQFGSIFRYDGTVSLQADVSEERKSEIVQQLKDSDEIDDVLAVYSTNAQVIEGDQQKEVTLMVTEDTDRFTEFIHLHTRTSQTPLNLTSSGAIITERMANDLGLKTGDEIELENEDGIRRSVEITGIAENYINNYVYMTSAGYRSTFDLRAQTNTLLVRVSEAYSHDDAAAARVISAVDEVNTVSFYTSIRDNFEGMIESLNYIVVVLILSAGALAFVVLYNLTNVNISERLREIATLKVLGFHDKEVNAYVYKENIILTLVGAAAGIFLGKALHLTIMVVVELDNIMFGRNINLISYVVSVVITVLFAIIVNQAMKPKLKAIPMVESLKSVE